MSRKSEMYDKYGDIIPSGWEEDGKERAEVQTFIELILGVKTLRSYACPNIEGNMIDQELKDNG